jgi:hypothetical protein
MSDFRVTMRFIKLGVIRLVALGIVLLSWLTACVHSGNIGDQSKDLEMGAYGEAKEIGRLSNPLLVEISGIAPSLRQDHLYWMLNDGGNPALLYVTDPNGDLRAEVRIQNAQNTDWEDMDSFVYNQQPYLLVADVGDNLAQRNSVQVYVIAEPKLHLDSPSLSETFSPIESSTVPVLYTLVIQYQEGPRDCEAVAVDVQQKKLLMLSKQDQPPLLYEVPLEKLFEYLGSSYPVFSEKPPVERLAINSSVSLTQFPNPDARALFSIVSDLIHPHQPTSMDVSSADDRAIILTYRYAFEFLRQPSQTWAQAFQSSPRLIRFPSLRQAEAITYTLNDRNLIITSESVGSPVLELAPLRQTDATLMERPFKKNQLIGMQSRRQNYTKGIEGS